jgi:hypothetical protein
MFVGAGLDSNHNKLTRETGIFVLRQRLLL